MSEKKENPSYLDLMDEDKLEKLSVAPPVIQDSRAIDREVRRILFEDLMEIEGNTGK